MRNTNTFFALAASLVLIPMAGIAQEAGTITFATGSVTAERQPPVPLAKGDPVQVADTVVTGARSRAQLRMIDDAKISIRPDSRLRIEEYFHAGDDEDTAAVSSRESSSVTSLIKGGFRTITGAIGSESPENYEVRTAVGVLGIRGTDYSAVFCNGDCGWAPGVTAGQPIEDGLYLGVTAGAIFFRNEAGDFDIHAGEFAFIPLSDRRLRRLQEPPAVLLDANDLRIDDPDPAAGRLPDGSDDDDPAGFDTALGTRRAPDPADPDSTAEGSREGDSETPAQSILGINPDGSPVDITPGSDPSNRDDRTISYSTGPLGQADSLFSGTRVNTPAEYDVDAGYNLTGFIGPYPGRGVPDEADFDIGSSTMAETGFDSVRVLRWGRWSGGTAGVTLLSDGSDASQDLGSQSIHWISGPEGQAPVMPITGSASYTLVGNTNPTDDLGNVGTIGGATFDADFTNMLVDTTVTLDINGSNWSAAGNGTIGGTSPAHIFNGIYGSVIVDGMTGGTGVFSGFFSEPGPTPDPTIPGGVGLTFGLQDMTGTNVSGALVFGDPQ